MDVYVFVQVCLSVGTSRPISLTDSSPSDLKIRMAAPEAQGHVGSWAALGAKRWHQEAPRRPKTVSKIVFASILFDFWLHFRWLFADFHFNFGWILLIIWFNFCWWCVGCLVTCLACLLSWLLVFLMPATLADMARTEQLDIYTYIYIYLFPYLYLCLYLYLAYISGFGFFEACH